MRRTLPLGGKWSPDEALALNTLMADAKGRYQISGPNAFNRCGFDEQVPARVYAHNNRISGERSIGAVRLVLIKAANERLGGTEEATTRDGLVTVYASRARALLDAVYDWARFDSLPRGHRWWIRGELERNRVSAAELVDMTLRYGDIGTLRRIGLLLDQAGVDGRLLRKLEKKVPKSSGLIPWILTSPERGSINRRWGVVVSGVA